MDCTGSHYRHSCFYTAGNFVNADGNTSGDQVATATLTVAEASTLPVRLNYFRVLFKMAAQY